MRSSRYLLRHDVNDINYFSQLNVKRYLLLPRPDRHRYSDWSGSVAMRTFKQHKVPLTRHLLPGPGEAR